MEVLASEVVEAAEVVVEVEAAEVLALVLAAVAPLLVNRLVHRKAKRFRKNQRESLYLH